MNEIQEQRIKAQGWQVTSIERYCSDGHQEDVWMHPHMRGLAMIVDCCGNIRVRTAEIVTKTIIAVRTY